MDEANRDSPPKREEGHRVQIPQRVIDPSIELGIYANNIDVLETNLDTHVDFSRVYVRYWPSGPETEGEKGEPQIKQATVARIILPTEVLRGFVTNYVSDREDLLRAIVSAFEEKHREKQNRDQQ